MDVKHILLPYSAHTGAAKDFTDFTDSSGPDSDTFCRVDLCPSAMFLASIQGGQGVFQALEVAVSRASEDRP